MYIEDRLFSETSDEVLYSVTMTEEEYDLFSEFQKEFTVRLEAFKKAVDPKVVSKLKSVPRVEPGTKAISAAEQFKIKAAKRFEKNPIAEKAVKKVSAELPGAVKLAAKKPLNNVSPNGSFTSQWGGRTWTSTPSY